MGALEKSGRDDGVWLFSKHQIDQSPSRADGVAFDTERKILASCVRFIMELGDAMEVPQLTKCAAIKFFQRFFMMESLHRHPPAQVATACLFLACKVQECVKRLRDVIFWSVKVKTRSPELPQGEELVEESHRFQDEKKLVLSKERDLLRVLNFDLELDHPYRYILVLVKHYCADKSQQTSLIQVGWNFVNDSLRTYIHVQYTDKEIATAALHLAVLFSHGSMSSMPETGQSWNHHFGVDPERMIEIGNRILDLYDL